MSAATVTLELPEAIYLRLVGAARATKRSLEEVLLHVVRLGSPPAWDDVPAEYQADLAALDRLDDGALWTIARACKSPAEVARHDELLERKSESGLSDAERAELSQLREASDRFMLRKAHAAALLRWRGHQVDCRSNVPVHP